MQSPPPELAPERINRLADAGLIVDLRPPAAFAGGHVPGSVSLAPGGSSREEDGGGVGEDGGGVGAAGVGNRGDSARRGHGVGKRGSGAGRGDEGDPAADDAGQAALDARAMAILELARVLAARQKSPESRDGTLGSGEVSEGDPASDADHPPLDIYLLSASLPLAHRVAARLTEVTGLGVAGILPASALAEWAAGGGRMRTIGRITPAELADRRAFESVEVLDANHIESLLPQYAELDPSATVVVARSGWSAGIPPGTGADRSSVGLGPVAATTAASILLTLGHRGEVLILETGDAPLPPPTG